MKSWDAMVEHSETMADIAKFKAEVQSVPMGYHTKEIKKGRLGESSKIREELEELEDAEAQGCRILMHCELADLYGALKARAAAEGLSMEDLAKMEALTAQAFQDGSRK